MKSLIFSSILFQPQIDIEDLINLFFSLNNPILYSLFATIIIFAITFYFYRYSLFPAKKRFSETKEYLENRNIKLMALFTELDPDPVIRIDMNGTILQTNESAQKLFKNLIQENTNINNLLPCISLNYREYILKNKDATFTEKVGEKYFSILLRGNSYLEFAQIYFRDITSIKKAEDELHKSQKELQNLSSHLQNLIEEDRSKVAQELHDGVGQNISFIRMNLLSLLEKYPETDKSELILKNIQYLEESIEELKEISYRLKPRLLSEMGLEAALKYIVEQKSNEFGLKGSLNIIGFDGAVEPKLETNLFRIIQELINNIIKHSKASQFNVQLMEKNDIIRLIVSDNGIGFNYNRIEKNSFGLVNIRERINNYNGRFKIDSSLNEGTIAVVEIQGSHQWVNQK